MRRFITHTTIFVGLALMLLAIALFILPNPVAKHNMLGALLDKHEMLRKTGNQVAGGPRIVVIGGSNVAYGLDSKRIQEALHIPVINAGLHASLGMKFYLTDVKPYIREGDVVLVIPEYSQYYTDSFYGNIELVSVLFDVYHEGRKEIDMRQWLHLMRFIPFYAATKLKISRQPSAIGPIGVYDRKAFNSNGDAYVHWTMPRRKFSPGQKVNEDKEVNPEAMKLLVDFQRFVKDKKATMLLLPPVFQSTSFVNQKPMIDKIYQSIKENHLPVIAEPERYQLPDSLFFDTASHLILPGIERRSDLIIEDLARVLPARHVSLMH